MQNLNTDFSQLSLDPRLHGTAVPRCGCTSTHDHGPPCPTCGDSRCIHERPHPRSDHGLSFHHNIGPSMQQLRWNSVFLFALCPSQSQGGNSEITLCFSHSTIIGPVRNGQILQEPGKPGTWCRFPTAPRVCPASQEHRGCLSREARMSRVAEK